MLTAVNKRNSPRARAPPPGGRVSEGVGSGNPLVPGPARGCNTPGMFPPVRMLHVEDSADDAELVRFALRGGPFETAAITRVETEAGYVAALASEPPDIVICDYDLPRFSAGRALEILRERELELPFILVSHHIGESAAVIAMQQGASDYLPKGDLGRLPKAISAALDRARARRERARALEALRESELTQRGILDSLPVRLVLIDGSGMIRSANRLWQEFVPAGHADPAGLQAVNYLEILDRDQQRGVAHAGALAEGIRAVLARTATSFGMEYELASGSGVRWYAARVMPLKGSDQGAVVSHRDITERMMAHVALQDANQRLRNLSKRMITVQEEERRAISRELHDDVSQTLGALKIGLHRLSQAAPPGQAELVNECLAAAGTALERLRQLSHDLRPPQLDQLGLEDALRWLAERQAAAAGIEVRCHAAGLEERRLPGILASACYRIAQEALNNATRHAQAHKVRIAVDCDGRLLRLAIHDDGVGFDESAARAAGLKSGSMGLIGMDERAQLAGGRLKVRSTPGGGTTVSAIFPLAGASLDEESGALAPSPA